MLAPITTTGTENRSFVVRKNTKIIQVGGIKAGKAFTIKTKKAKLK